MLYETMITANVNSADNVVNYSQTLVTSTISPNIGNLYTNDNSFYCSNNIPDSVHDDNPDNDVFQCGK